MHMFNRQKNIICETISKLQNRPDDEIRAFTTTPSQVTQSAQPLYGIQTSILIRQKHTTDTTII